MTNDRAHQKRAQHSYQCSDQYRHDVSLLAHSLIAVDSSVVQDRVKVSPT